MTQLLSFVAIIGSSITRSHGSRKRAQMLGGQGPTAQSLDPECKALLVVKMVQDTKHNNRVTWVRCIYLVKWLAEPTYVVKFDPGHKAQYWITFDPGPNAGSCMWVYCFTCFNHALIGSRIEAPKDHAGIPGTLPN